MLLSHFSNIPIIFILQLNPCCSDVGISYHLHPLVESLLLGCRFGATAMGGASDRRCGNGRRIRLERRQWMARPDQSDGDGRHTGSER
jgi:hypothetical protein